MDTGLCSAVRLRPTVLSHGDSSRVVCIILSFYYFKLIRTSLFTKALELSIPPRAGFLAPWHWNPPSESETQPIEDGPDDLFASLKLMDLVPSARPVVTFRNSLKVDVISAEGLGRIPIKWSRVSLANRGSVFVLYTLYTLVYLSIYPSIYATTRARARDRELDKPIVR